MPDLNFELDKIIELSLRDPVDTLRYFLMCSEEVGELAQAMLAEDGTKPRELDEPSYSEAVDITIMGLVMFHRLGGNPDELKALMRNKLAKWEKRLDEKTF